MGIRKLRKNTGKVHVAESSDAIKLISTIKKIYPPNTLFCKFIYNLMFEMDVCSIKKNRHPLYCVVL